MEHETMTAWTLQTEAAWEHMQANGVLRGDGRRIFKEHRQAYRWIMDRMHERLPTYQGGFPVWLWTKWCEQHRQPDLRSSGHFPPGQRAVQLELEIPKKEILLHDFYTWHYVLADIYLPDNLEDDHEQVTTKEEKEESWNKIFDVRCSRSIAAVIESVRLDQVRTVQHFISSPDNSL